MSNRLQDVHDSIEDARTEPALYDKYVELEAEGSLDDAVQQLYEIGRDTNWEVRDEPVSARPVWRLGVTLSLRKASPN